MKQVASIQLRSTAYPWQKVVRTTLLTQQVNEPLYGQIKQGKSDNSRYGPGTGGGKH